PVIVENVGGAGGTIGVSRVVRAAPDGHTINFSNVASHVFSSIVYKLQYDMLRDLEPVALLTISPFWLVASNKVPAKNLHELITWLKSNAEKATWGIVGPGSPSHLCGVYFQNHPLSIRALSWRRPCDAGPGGRANRLVMPGGLGHPAERP